MPPAAEAIREAGYDICCHGWRWVEHFKLDEATEREHIRRAVESLEQTVGRRPLGWYCRYGPSVNTRRLVVEEGGFLYDSDSYADELPYYVMAEGRPQLVVPYTLTNNDLKWGTANLASGDDFFAILREAFDFLYDEGRRGAQDDERRHAYAPSRPSRPGIGPRAFPRLREKQARRLGLQARGDRAALAYTSTLAGPRHDAPENRTDQRGSFCAFRSASSASPAGRGRQD